MSREEAEISEDELQGAIREAISHGVRADIVEPALAYWDRIEDLVTVLRAEMPDLLKELGL